jgi:hypothetical protein
MCDPYTNLGKVSYARGFSAFMGHGSSALMVFASAFIVFIFPDLSGQLTNEEAR